MKLIYIHKNITIKKTENLFIVAAITFPIVVSNTYLKRETGTDR